MPRKVKKRRNWGRRRWRWRSGKIQSKEGCEKSGQKG